MKSSAWSWDAMLIASILLIAGLCTQTLQTARAEGESPVEGKIVRISPDPEEGEPIPLAWDGEAREVEVEVETKVEAEATTDQPAYWIGISGRPLESAVLRTHFQLAADMGIVIEQVIPESPAEKAGLRKHDIILRANGAGVHGMKVLQEHVREHGAEPLELKLIRLGKEETLVVVPEKRPTNFSASLGQPGRDRWDGLGGRGEAIGKLMEQMLAERGLPGGMQRLGPDMFLEGPQAVIPHGVSITMQREDGGPTKITVKRGDETWQVVGGDPESLEKLPADLRPMVRRMLEGNPGFNWEAELEQLIPEGLRERMGQRPAPVATPQEKEINERMQRLEQELDELKKRLAEE